jgi:hypothetical protein
VDEAIICQFGTLVFFFSFPYSSSQIDSSYWLPVNDILIVLLFLLRSSTEANAYSQMLAN